MHIYDPLQSQHGHGSRSTPVEQQQKKVHSCTRRQFAVHMALSGLRAGFLACLLMLAYVSCEPQPAHSGAAGKRASNAFFKSLDTNANGQIDSTEASAYIGEHIGGSDYDTQQELTQAVHQLMQKLDGADTGATVSLTEFDLHLHKALEVRRCTHGMPVAARGGRCTGSGRHAPGRSQCTHACC